MIPAEVIHESFTATVLMDMLRGVSVALFFVLGTQIVYVLRHYLKIVRIERAMGHPVSGLLPTHVVFISIGLLGLAAEAVAQNITRIGEPINYFAIGNPIFLGVSVYALYTLMTFERVRYSRITTPPDLL